MIDDAERCRRALLVDGDEPFRRAMRLRCEQLGWEVCEAGSVAEALRQLQPPPDCILLEIDLPDGRGEVIVQRVRAMGLRTLIVVTAAVYNPRRLQAAAFDGANVIIAKADAASFLDSWLRDDGFWRRWEATPHRSADESQGEG